MCLALVMAGRGIGALVEGGTHGWNTPLNRIQVAATVGGLVAFALIERAAPHPVLPLHLFTRPRFVLGLLVGALFQFGAYGAQFATLRAFPSFVLAPQTRRHAVE
ncbi:hypothetical protein AB0D11_18090 [Streptomyces monashensis]|uniref:hypothetical protein n=1 Tax=Streptomyces monashensis TaxID=1678012 RepID=UPI0033C97504